MRIILGLGFICEYEDDKGRCTKPARLELNIANYEKLRVCQDHVEAFIKETNDTSSNWPSRYLHRCHNWFSRRIMRREVDLPSDVTCFANIFFSGDFGEAELFCEREKDHTQKHYTKGIAHDEYGKELEFTLSWRYSQNIQ
jgi:hypothetical protein